jgi:hypothetical protein
MPQSTSSRGFVLRLVLFTLAGWLLWALGKNNAQTGLNDELAVAAASETKPTRPRAKEAGFSKRRLATTLAFTTLFFAGAAFSAGAGDLVVGAVEGSTDAAATSTEAAPEDPAASAPADDPSSADDSTPADPAPDAAPGPAPSGDDQSGDSAGAPADGQPADGQPADDQSSGDQPADGGQPAGSGSDSAGSGSGQPADGGDPAAGGGSDGSGGQPDEPAAGPDSPAHAGDGQPSSSGGDAGPVSADQAAADLEFDGQSSGIVWLHRNLGDPTPPASRLSRQFSHNLVRISRENHVDWAFVLGVLRAQGFHGRNPATARHLDALASRLASLHANADEWRAALALNGRTSFADRAEALTRYNRAVGLRALVRGLQAEKGALEQRLLSDPRVDIYAGGRSDIANHRINVRVVALVLYLAESHGQVTVSCLISGHGLYARPGVVSAHIYGLAVDIAGLEGQSILGHQQAGGLTERAVRNILLLPAELQPKQVISLLGLGGPSFPLADHYDHIHVGY